MSESDGIYEDILNQIIDTTKENPIIIINHPDHIHRIRAGLSYAKKEYNKVANFYGSKGINNKVFKYTYDKKDPSKVTISLTDKNRVRFIVTNA